MYSVFEQQKPLILKDLDALKYKSKKWKFRG